MRIIAVLSSQGFKVKFPSLLDIQTVSGKVKLYSINNINPLAAEFLLASNWHGDNFLHTFTLHGIFFPCLLFGTDFSLVFPFPGLRIEALPLSIVQDKCKYKIFKAENQETQFPLLKTKPSIDKHKFSSFLGWQFQCRFIGHLCHNSRIERADLLTIHGTIVESRGSIY